VCVHSLTEKRLELSTPNLVHVYSMAVARYALTWRSKGQRSRLHSYENRHSHMAASNCCGHCAAAAAGMWLHVVWLLKFLFRHCVNSRRIAAFVTQCTKLDLNNSVSGDIIDLSATAFLCDVIEG